MYYSVESSAKTTIISLTAIIILINLFIFFIMNYFL